MDKRIGRWAAPVLLTLGLVLAGCGGDDGAQVRELPDSETGSGTGSGSGTGTGTGASPGTGSGTGTGTE